MTYCQAMLSLPLPLRRDDVPKVTFSPESFSRQQIQRNNLKMIPSENTRLIVMVNINRHVTTVEASLWPYALSERVSSGKENKHIKMHNLTVISHHIKFNENGI